MLKLNRPNKPADFDNYNSTTKWRVVKFADLYKNAHNLRCGYCEKKTSGDIDHFRPKGEIHNLSLNPSEWGTERPGTMNRGKKRVTNLVARPGYTWLSNTWENFIFCCDICNRKWKLCLFPISGQRKTSATCTNIEIPLLLNPYDDLDIQDHIYFDDHGLIYPHVNSSKGLETIKTCFLSRPSLISSRVPLAKDFFRSIIEFQSAQTIREKNKALVNIYHLGNDREHCGMIRNNIHRIFHMDWHTYVQLVSRLPEFSP